MTLVANSKAATTTRKLGRKGAPVYALESGWTTPRVLTRLSADYTVTVLGSGSGVYDLTVVTTAKVTQYALMRKADLEVIPTFPLTATVVPFGQTPPTYGYAAEWYLHGHVPAQGWVAHPLDAGTGLPVYVLVHGGPFPLGHAADMSPLAVNLAGRGAVAFCIDYRALASDGGGWPQAMLDVAAGIVQARTLAPKYGGTGKITLVAHSFGGYPSSVLSLGGVPGVPAGGLPDAYVAIAAISSNAGVRFSGGDFDGTPDPISLGGNRPGFPVTMIRGGSDIVASADDKEGFAKALNAGIHPGRNVIISGADHSAVLFADATLDAIFAT